MFSWLPETWARLPLWLSVMVELPADQMPCVAALYSWPVAGSLGLALLLLDTCCRSEGVRQLFSSMMSTSPSSSSSSLSPSGALLLWEQQNQTSQQWGESMCVSQQCSPGHSHRFRAEPGTTKPHPLCCHHDEGDPTERWRNRSRHVRAQ